MERKYGICLIVVGIVCCLATAGCGRGITDIPVTQTSSNSQPSSAVPAPSSQSPDPNPNPTSNVPQTPGSAYTTPEQPQYFYFGNWGDFFGDGSSIYGVAAANGAATTIPGPPIILSQGPVFYPRLAGAGDLIFYSDNTGRLLIWSVDTQSGALTQLSSSEGALGSIDPSYRFMYLEGSAIFGYLINHQTGGLTPLQGSPFQLLPEVYEMDVGQISLNGTWMCGPGGSFNGPGSLSDLVCVKRDPSTGSILTGPNDQFLGLPRQYMWATFVASGYLMAAESAPDQYDGGSQDVGIGIFQLSSSGFQQVASYPGLTGWPVAEDRSGTLLAFLNGMAVTLFRFDPASVTLTQIAEATFNDYPQSLAFSCDGKYLAVSYTVNKYLSIFAVSSNGLTEISGSPITVGKGWWGGVATACTPAQ